MLKRPSSRRKSSKEGIELNLVPILDTMVTLIAFVLFSMSFLALVSIESPFPEAAAKISHKQLQEKPLQLTISLQKSGIEIWSPFERIRTRRVEYTSEGLPDTFALHEAMIEIKRDFPQEDRVVIVPHAGVNYDTLISVMDTVRNLEPTDPAIYYRDSETGVDHAVQTLFPRVIFGNLLGDA